MSVFARYLGASTSSSSSSSFPLHTFFSSPEHFPTDICIDDLFVPVVFSACALTSTRTLLAAVVVVDVVY